MPITKTYGNETLARKMPVKKDAVSKIAVSPTVAGANFPMANALVQI